MVITEAPEDKMLRLSVPGTGQGSTTCRILYVSHDAVRRHVFVENNRVKLRVHSFRDAGDIPSCLSRSTPQDESTDEEV
ncbi:hypothetical protein F2P81_014581 [Scophthalmus maximus]|uniref:Uncharacterized protein n=1 Tax=Scophthalmus maximus TaxID=52904 RepID=A0A6A4SMD2_SCOMX|nr:hypothetical protein F2P81_014581 [Scophthalmus maximus]